MAKRYVDPEVNGIILDRGMNDLILNDLDPGVENSITDEGGEGEWHLKNIRVPLPDGSSIVADPSGEILYEDR